jgi:hypothetical protein
MRNVISWEQYTLYVVLIPYRGARYDRVSSSPSSKCAMLFSSSLLYRPMAPPATNPSLVPRRLPKASIGRGLTGGRRHWWPPDNSKTLTSGRNPPLDAVSLCATARTLPALPPPPSTAATPTHPLPPNPTW